MTKISDRNSLWGADLLWVTDWEGFSLSCQGRCSGVPGSGSMAQAAHIMVDHEAEEGWEPRAGPWILKDLPLVNCSYRLSLPEGPMASPNCATSWGTHVQSESLPEAVQIPAGAKTVLWEGGGREEMVGTASGQVVLGNLDLEALKPSQSTNHGGHRTSSVSQRAVAALRKM